ncbi:LADA_0F00232g1_1 [Lachancea dasiensis]|uniref:Protein FMP52, mitochondrial n=1 Tax=Lachancea dasiensis TaxID=1072105 RepID=A0A1G4JIB9_9SACH|nr:LADA_0F00232g1_1 [Lachancea dasiensis]
MSLNVLIFGATGLCGSSFVKYAVKERALSVTTISRRKLTVSYEPEKVNSVIEENSENWSHLIPPNTDIVLSGLATTRGEAGKENFYKVDHDLNLALARAAKSQGCTTYVLVSSIGADANSMFFYLKTKGEIERDVLALNFDRTIILRPGPLVGERDKSKGLFNAIVAKLGGLLYKTSLQSLLSYPVYGDDVGKVGIKLALDSTHSEKVQIVESKEILKLLT